MSCNNEPNRMHDKNWSYTIRPLFVEDYFLIPRPHEIILPRQVRHYVIITEHAQI